MINQDTFSLTDYFIIEESQIYKNEYLDGKLKPVAETTIAHNAIVGNTYFNLRLVLKAVKTNRQTFNSSQKIYIPELNQVVYADSFVVSGDIKTYQSGNQAITNPVLIVEVLSDSTSGYDRGEKFRKYQTLPSFKEYVLVDQFQPIVDVLYKEENLKWRLKTYIGLEEILQLESIDVEIKVKDLYEDVEGLQAPQFKLPV